MQAVNTEECIQKPQKKVILYGALLGTLIGVVSFAPIWIHYNGQLMDYGDYFIQYVPFIKELKRMLLSGNLSWSWNSFLGDSFIGAYSYYTVYNPFAWIVMLFHDNLILYCTMFATLLKLSVSMVGALLYFRLFCKNDIYALTGALLYTFSGFTLVNTMFYFFLDIVAVFPFLMYGLELLIREKKKLIYVFALFVNASINFYFFVSSVLFIILYVFFRLHLYKISAWKSEWNIFLRIAGYSIIGTGLAGIALFPSLYAILGLGKATEAIGTKMRLFYWPQKILEHLKVIVAPIESGRYLAFFDASSWTSTGLYLPVFGVYCVLLWCFRKHDWLKNSVCY